MNETWIDIIKAIEWEQWIQARDARTFSLWSLRNKKTVDGIPRFMFLDDTYIIKCYVYVFDESNQAIKTATMSVKNTTYYYNPYVNFRNVTISPKQSMTYDSVSVTDYMMPKGFIRDMHDLDPLRFEFFKSPIDKINYVTAKQDG